VDGRQVPVPVCVEHPAVNVVHVAATSTHGQGIRIESVILTHSYNQNRFPNQMTPTDIGRPRTHTPKPCDIVSVRLGRSHVGADLGRFAVRVGLCHDSRVQRVSDRFCP
jgi:hypothetical protein